MEIGRDCATGLDVPFSYKGINCDEGISCPAVIDRIF